MRASRNAAALVAVLAVGTAALAGCTSSGTAPQSPTPNTITRTVVQTPTSSHVPTKPVSTGPTTAVTAAKCPFLDQQAAADKVGMRLERITVLHSGGKAVGCRFYALQNSPLHDSEHLPGPNQPVIEIQTYRYPSALSAHNAFVLMSRKGTNPQRASIVGQAPGLCFQTDFYSKDKGTDWACAFSKGARVALVHTVVTGPAVLNAILVARAVGARV